MNINEYAKAIEPFAVYPAVGTGSPIAIAYCALGLSGEMGEFVNATGDNAVAEAGDVLWYLTRMHTELALASSQAPVYPSTGSGLSIPYTLVHSVTLLSNASTVSEWAKKRMRDNKPVTKELTDALVHIQDGVEYALLLMGSSMSVAMQANVDKLNSRKERGVINGDGDNR